MNKKLRINENTGKPKILFMHGYNGNFQFMQLLLKLQRDYDIISFDFPCCGDEICDHLTTIESYSNFAKKIIDSINEPLIVLGHSLGGAIAVNIASHLLVKKIILISPLNPYLDNPKLSSWLLPQNYFEAMEGTSNLLAKKRKMPYTKEQSINLPFFNPNEICFEYMVNKQITNQDYLRTTLLTKYRAVKKPTCIIQGRNDYFVLPESIASVEKAFGFKVFWLENTGHLPISEKTHEVNKIINEWIK